MYTEAQGVGGTGWGEERPCGVYGIERRGIMGSLRAEECAFHGGNRNVESGRRRKVFGGLTE